MKNLSCNDLLTALKDDKYKDRLVDMAEGKAISREERKLLNDFLNINDLAYRRKSIQSLLNISGGRMEYFSNKDYREEISTMLRKTSEKIEKQKDLIDCIDVEKEKLKNDPNMCGIVIKSFAESYEKVKAETIHEVKDELLKLEALMAMQRCGDLQTRDYTVGSKEILDIYRGIHGDEENSALLFNKLPQSLLLDRVFLSDLLKIDYNAYEHFDYSMKNDKSLAITAINESNGNAYYLMSPKMRADTDIVLAAYKENPKEFGQHIPDDVKSNISQKKKRGLFCNEKYSR